MAESPHLRLVARDGNLVETEGPDIQRGTVRIKDKESEHRLSFEEIYPDESARPSAVNSALKLLYDVDTALDVAVRAIREEERFLADDSTQRCLSLLPEIFLFRSLGDGLGVGVVSMFHALQNLNGMPANEEQLLALASIARFLRKEPTCSVEVVVEMIDRLVDAGLQPQPPGLAPLGQELDEDVLR
jgi:hypothetical protein